MKQEDFYQYLSQRFALEVGQRAPKGEVLEGTLIDLKDAGLRYPIRRGIPRFVTEASNYCDSFGLQWNAFRTTQLDSVSGLTITADRLWRNTKWAPEELRGKRVLEVGSGAGRFTEILLGAGARVASFDYSVAADANYLNNRKGDLFLFQGSVYAMPLERASFDFVFCYGVLQHTPDPARTYREMFEMLRPGGRLSMDSYRKIRLSKIWPHAKYSWRPLTSRMHPRLLMAIIKAYMPLWQPVDTWIRHLPRGLGYEILWRLPIPCWNYVDQLKLSKKDLVQWAIMDTFDALGARYDFPQTLESIEAMVRSTDVEAAEVFYGSNGIVANVRRRAAGKADGRDAAIANPQPRAAEL